MDGGAGGRGFLAKLPDAENGVVSPMDMPKNIVLEACTCAATPLGGGEKGDTGQSAWVHWRGNLGERSILSIGFSEKNSNAPPSQNDNKNRHDSKVGGAFSSLNVPIGIWGKRVFWHKKNRRLWLYFPMLFSIVR